MANAKYAAKPGAGKRNGKGKRYATPVWIYRGENIAVTILRESEFYPMGNADLVGDVKAITRVPRWKARAIVADAINHDWIRTVKGKRGRVHYYLTKEPITEKMMRIVNAIACDECPKVEGEFKHMACRFIDVGIERAESIIERAINAGMIRRTGCRPDAIFWDGDTNDARLEVMNEGRLFI